MRTKFFYQLLRKQLNKTTSGPTPKDEEKAKAVRDLLDRSIETKGVVDIFAAAGIEKADISILDDRFLEEFKSHEQENLRRKRLVEHRYDAKVPRNDAKAPPHSPNGCSKITLSRERIKRCRETMQKSRGAVQIDAHTLLCAAKPAKSCEKRR